LDDSSSVFLSYSCADAARGGRAEAGLMQHTDWIDLLRLIPTEQHNTLVVTTLTGVDLNVETILRIEEQYLVFRGRVSGITDEGRVFFVPFRQIDFLQMNRYVKEAEVRRLYGEDPGSETTSPLSETITGGSRQGLAIPSGSRQGTGGSTPAPTRPSSLPGIAAKLSGAPGARLPEQQDNEAEALTPPRNSILERLRAQRTSVLSNKPLGR
jgi:hypothetical protein